MATLSPDSNVTWCSSNPKRAGSASAARFDLYSKATTVLEARRLGALGSDLRWDQQHGFCEINAPHPRGLFGALAYRPCEPGAILGAVLHDISDDLSGDPPIFGKENPQDLIPTDLSPAPHGSHDESFSLTGHEPISLNSALKRPDSSAVVAAITKQTTAFDRHNTWHPHAKASIPTGIRPLRMLATITQKRDGTLKARVCLAEVKGSTPPLFPGTAGHHIDTKSSPTPGFTAIKVIAAHAAHFGYVLRADDITDAYLCGPQREKPIYAYYPYGWSTYLQAVYGADRTQWPYDPDTHLACITGNIWGSQDAGARFRAVLHPVLLELGYDSTALNEAFYHRIGTSYCVLVWTDDVCTSMTAEQATILYEYINNNVGKTKGARTIGAPVLGSSDLFALTADRHHEGGRAMHTSC